MRKTMSFSVLFMLIPLILNAQKELTVYNEITLNGLNRIYQLGHYYVAGYNIMFSENGPRFYELPGSTKENMEKDRPLNMVIRQLDSLRNFIKDTPSSYNNIDIDIAHFATHYSDKKTFHCNINEILFLYTK
ncbi:hypothetical protein FNH22_12095 [Fulvivirga sp. M361]|uniref:hypothetical protein n=1 Tax=Fulvivirga sp. M361 TaxID=2594266 RepID=UPI00117A7526|nr:hypothetical protein [Fulvivirga sp. M361]TRX58616.1 hypothetical protein FNH22_12095 [Fulvivirga sp. M361]